MFTIVLPGDVSMPHKTETEKLKITSLTSMKIQSKFVHNFLKIFCIQRQTDMQTATKTQLAEVGGPNKSYFAESRT